ncbi:protein of unknown function [Xenorhabdus poinarii G6]|uniref:Uncharacterized protein n=1 Tax=Xenorhabdus poinarii G6 TaxID=1354304 RepID=A0A068QZA9_9GAMM|nr:protein of unknown function [Xenorhabdus poinarii G6]
MALLQYYTGCLLIGLVAKLTKKANMLMMFTERNTIPPEPLGYKICATTSKPYLEIKASSVYLMAIHKS